LLTSTARGSGGRCSPGTKLNLKPVMTPLQCLVTPITPVIAAHAGIGAWGVFYQNED